jgi:hypothetical protein
VVVIPLRRLDQVGQKALRFALTISPDVYVVQILAEELDTEDLRPQWRERVEEAAGRVGTAPPRLVQIRSPYRRFFGRLLEWLGPPDRGRARPAGDRPHPRAGAAPLVPVPGEPSGVAPPRPAAPRRRAAGLGDVDAVVPGSDAGAGPCPLVAGTQ